MMTGKPWFRLWSEMLDDPKVGTLSDAQFRLWVEILCLACKAGNNGDTNCNVSETEWKLRRNVSETLQELLHRGLVTFQNNKDGKQTIYVTKWKSRQYESDSSTPRVQKYREKTRSERQCNDDETFL